MTIGNLIYIKGFFQTYNEKYSDNFKSLFGDEVTESDIFSLDICFQDLYGERELLGKYTELFENKGADETIGRIVTIANKLNYDKWLSTKETMLKALSTDIEKPLTTVRKSKSDKKSDSDTKNQVNAFDGDNASDSDNSKTSYNDTQNSETTINASNGKTATENALRQIDFTRNNDYLKIIIYDVLKIACVSVYDTGYDCPAKSGGSSYDDTELREEIDGIKELIPNNASTDNKLATMADIQGGSSYDDTEIRQEIVELTARVEINALDIDDLKDDTASNTQAIQTANGNISANIQAIQTANGNISANTQAVESVQNEVDDIKSLIPTNASTLNMLATMADIQGGGGNGVTVNHYVRRYTFNVNSAWASSSDKVVGFDNPIPYNVNAIYYAYYIDSDITGTKQYTVVSVGRSNYTGNANDKLIIDNLCVQLHRVGSQISAVGGNYFEVGIFEVIFDKVNDVES